MIRGSGRGGEGLAGWTARLLRPLAGACVCLVGPLTQAIRFPAPFLWVTLSPCPAVMVVLVVDKRIVEFVFWNGQRVKRPGKTEDQAMEKGKAMALSLGMGEA